MQRQLKPYEKCWVELGWIVSFPTRGHIRLDFTVWECTQDQCENAAGAASIWGEEMSAGDEIEKVQSDDYMSAWGAEAEREVWRKMSKKRLEVNELEIGLWV